MAFSPDPPEKGAETSGKENPALEAGLAALKQGNYEDAIAHLESVCEIDLNQKSIFRAQMGLAIAYERIGDVPSSLALCKTLSKNSSPQVKEWALRTLASLADRYPEESRGAGEQGSRGAGENSSDTGFVPLDPTALTPSIRSKVPLNPSPAGGAGERGSGGAGENSHSALSTPHSPLSTQHSALSTQHSKSPQSRVPTEAKHSDKQAEKLSPNSDPNALPVEEKKETLAPYQAEWKQAGRAKKWQRLPAKTGFHFDVSQLWGVQALTAIALLISVFWALGAIINFAIKTAHNLLIKLRFIYVSDDYYSSPMRFVPVATVIATLALVAASPWLMDGLLRSYYGLKSLSLETLTSRSPEAARVLQRFTREQRLPAPTLFVLPDSAPLALTYGNLRRTARIAVSQGLLDRLADDEIASIYAAQLGHIVHWDFVLMSLGVLVFQVPYIFYWRVSALGEQSQNAFLRFVAGAFAALGYGIYWLFRWPILWLSRARIYYSDRISCEITGNPNGLTRALLKIAIGIANDVERQGQTSYLLEGFELLTPVGYRQAITLGSLYPLIPLEPILAWDYLNPSTRWLAINNSHPPMGKRLQILARYASYWNVETELNFSSQSSLTAQKSKFFLQGSPYLGVFLGLALAGILWSIGAISNLVRFRPLDWMWGDRSLLYGSLLIGISMGIFLRINSFFPDIKPFNLPGEALLPDLLANPAALPVDSQPVRLQGKLLGRPGIGNWLCQDLILQTPTGLVKLHHFSRFGPIGNLLPHSTRPSDLVNRPLTATGWFRRGATPWIDIDTLQTQTGRTSQSFHPIWSTILGLAAAVWGAYIIYKGGG
ncbi:zinc metalloprotease HtpX [Argonema antarcticum]|uniref:zinc metalloprotease HtpX n=1 Tax=Argonema antarcticum TaxID=2942763 RepID=UPI002010E035|nr:zinc metalloprotease HtpX [Argonema antarcticum]MCL1471413.1 M48 family metalloprotease [Argonema antarcticum A004/B2]